MPNPPITLEQIPAQNAKSLFPPHGGHRFTLAGNIGEDWWDRPRPQPVRITVHVHTNPTRAGASDDVTHSIHYGNLSKALLELQAPARAFPDFASLAEAAAAAALGPQFTGVQAVRIIAEAPKLFLQAQGPGVEITRPRTPASSDRIYIKDLTIPTIIGVNPPERLRKQLVAFHRAPGTSVVRKDHFHTFLHTEAVEQLTEVRRMEGVVAVTVRAQKPSAVSFAHSSGVETRILGDPNAGGA